MTWHIVSKDWRQLWPFVTLVAAVQAADVAVQIALGHFGDPPALAVVGQVLPGVVWLVIALLIAAAVHQDVLPGVTQDWLARPIRRRDLLQAKVLFVVIAVHVPMFLADLTHGVSEGFVLRESASAAAVHTGLVMFVLDVPMFALATVTRSAIEMLVGVVAMWMVVLLGVGVGVAARGGAPPPFASTGMQWMTPAFWSLVAGMAAFVVVPLQYFRRATRQARLVVAGAVIVAPMLSFSSWSAAFGLQQQLSPDLSLARSIGISFDPATRTALLDGAEAATHTTLLPLRISGAEPDSIVASDRAIIRLADASRTVLFVGPTTGGRPRDDFRVRVGSTGEAYARQRVVLPESVYARVRSASVRAEVDYSLTLFQRDATATVAAANGSARLTAFGWCRTRVDGDGDEIEVGCLAMGPAPTCLAATLQDSMTGSRNPEHLACEPDYTPSRIRLFPGVMARFGGGVRFRDPQGLYRFPVDGSRVATAQVRLTSYRPAAHFTRHVVIPEIRPADWIVIDR